MFCNYCGAQNPDGSLYCSKCGKKISFIEPTLSSDNSLIHRVEIFRESQAFLINPPINLVIDSEKRLSIANGETVSLTLPDGSHELCFSQSFRKKTVSIELSEDMSLNIKWNRITGAIEVKQS